MKKLLIAGVLAVGAGVALMLYFFDPARVPIYPVCTFHQWTALDCPGCGSLRAMHALLHGRLAEAFEFNPLLVLSLPLLAWLAVRFALSQRKAGRPFTIRPVWLWSGLGVWLAFGILRNLPLPLLTASAP